MKKISILFILLLLILVSFNFVDASSIAQRLSGKILLEVEQNGEAYYVYPNDFKRYYLGRPQNAFDIMRSLGLGITNANLAEIPQNTDYWTGNTNLIDRVRGKILLQVEQNGEAWYVYPNNGKRYYLGRPHDAFEIMRSLGLGITTKDLETISTGSVNTDSGDGEEGQDSNNEDTENNTSSEDPNSIVVGNTSELNSAIESANSGGEKTILLQNGTYTIDSMLWISADGVTIRSESGNREAVIIQGNGMTSSTSHIFNVAGDNLTVRDMTLQRVANHAIQLQLDVDGFTASNLHILDTGEQMIKAAYDQNNISLSSDNGLVENSLFEYSAGVGPQYYIGGVDAHNAKNWIVRGNTFKNIKSPSNDIAEHAIHFWSDSENTLVERNTIINCDRGIGFGLGDRGHIGGIIRNNMIYHDASEGFADVSIGLESARNSQVYNNTIYMVNSYPNAIEYRFGSTIGVEAYNNLTNKAIAARDGSSGNTGNNVTSAQLSWFISPETGNLRLASSVSTVVDQGRTISGLTNDFDNETRPKGNGIDIGADEF